VHLCGLDLTHQVCGSPELVERLRAVGGPAAQLCVEILETELASFGRYATSSPLPPLHDPVALLAVTHPHLFERQRTPILVELGGTHSRGATLVDRRLVTAEGTRPADEEVQTHWVHTVDGDAALDLIVDACRRWA
jgi:purine nucleosidase